MKSKSAMTLDRVLSRFGFASRTVARDQIRAGRVKVNGRVVRDPDVWVRPATDIFHLDGKRLKQAYKVYLLFYKPKGVITSHGDPGARDTIYDHLDAATPWVAPVGRLDRDTSGLLLLTNDTEFASFVTDPASGIEVAHGCPELLLGFADQDLIDPPACGLSHLPSRPDLSFHRLRDGGHGHGQHDSARRRCDPRLSSHLGPGRRTEKLHGTRDQRRIQDLRDGFARSIGHRE